MVNLGALDAPGGRPPSNRMSDGSELFPYLWRYFLHHQPLRDWLMRSGQHAAASVSPKQAAQGIAFCCNFDVPGLWQDMATSFDLGEMFIPDHPYSHFMCGTVVAATSFHKHLVCALGSAASRDPSCLPSYQTCVRRMVVDMGSSRSINIIEFSWMQDGALIVTVKVLVPPDPSVPYQSAGCTGAFAVFTDVQPGGAVPTAPRSLVSFVEVPRCPFCTERGSLGCYCTGSLAARASREDDEYSSAVWPPQIANDVQGTAVDTYHNIRTRLDLIQHIAHVKITAHVVTTQEVTMPIGPPCKTYKLGPSRWLVKAVLFRPSTIFEADTLRQVADKLRLLRAGSLRVTNALLGGMKVEEPEPVVHEDVIEQESFAKDVVTVDEIESPQRERFDTVSCPSVSNLDGRLSYMKSPNGISVESSRVSVACTACDGDLSRPHTCAMYRNDRSQASRTGTNTSQGLGSRITETVSRVTDSVSREAETITAGSMPAKKIKCPRCGKTFSQQGSLNRHLKNIHDAQKIPCEFCNLAFGQMYDLKRHQRRRHRDQYSPNVRGERTNIRLLRQTSSGVVH